MVMAVGIALMDSKTLQRTLKNRESGMERFTCDDRIIVQEVMLIKTFNSAVSTQQHSEVDLETHYQQEIFGFDRDSERAMTNCRFQSKLGQP